MLDIPAACCDMQPKHPMARDGILLQLPGIHLSVEELEDQSCRSHMQLLAPMLEDPSNIHSKNYSPGRFDTINVVNSDLIAIYGFIDCDHYIDMPPSLQAWQIAQAAAHSKSAAGSTIDGRRMFSPLGVWAWKKGANTRDSTAMSLMRMLREGPEVSLSGSPTVSPMTAALWASDPLPPRERACSVA